MRSLVLTSDSVAARMLPCLGTPFDDIGAPLVGVNVLNGTPAHFSVWRQPNHNLVIVGSSGSGKSVAAKTLLVRHVMEDVVAVVIDPDSEYEAVMRAVGGRYLELGPEALNPLAVTAGAPADTAAGLVLPILSVMAGDDRGMRDGRPIRRLPDEDQGWLHGELVYFLSTRDRQAPAALMRDLVAHLEGSSITRALTERERERCRVITARLRRFTQGRRAEVFDRPSTFAIADQPIAIGLRSFAMTYGADLTPALAVLLTAILDALGRRRGRMVVVVDEAHRVTSDPDAGEVLGQLVRQARKHGAGVWMLSQRIEDFVRTDLGRTLAATSSSKLVLGTEEAVLDEVREVFKLGADEVAAICPSVPGRGVLLAGAERAVVSVVPGPAIMALADTRARGSRAVRVRWRRSGGDPVATAAQLLGGSQRAPAPRLRLRRRGRAGGSAGAGAGLLVSNLIPATGCRRRRQPGGRRDGVVMGAAEPLAPGRFRVSQGFGCTAVSAEPLAATRVHAARPDSGPWRLPLVPHGHRPGGAQRADGVRGGRRHRQRRSSRRWASACTSCSPPRPRRRAGVVYLYGHLSEVAVPDGDVVHAGDPIGYVGSTGQQQRAAPALRGGCRRRPGQPLLGVPARIPGAGRRRCRGLPGLGHVGAGTATRRPARRRSLVLWCAP